MAHVFLGITIIGFVMTVRIIFEGLSTIQGIQGKIVAARAFIVTNRTKAIKEKMSLEKLEKQIAMQKVEVEELIKKETELKDQIRTLHAELDKDQYY